MKRGLMNRIYLLVTISIVSISLLISCHPKKYQPISVLSVVPNSSPLFLKINDPAVFSQSLGKQNYWWQTLVNIEKMQPLSRSILAIDSIINTTSELKNFLAGKEVVVSLFPAKDQSIELLVVIPVDISGDQKKAESFINGFLKREQQVAKRRKYNRTNLFEVSSATNERKFGYAFSHNFLIISEEIALLEETIDHLGDKKAEMPAELAPLLKTTNNQAQVNIFINHRLAGEILSGPLSEQMKEKNKQLCDFSGWSELDVTIKDEKVILSGFTNGDSKQNYFAPVMQNQQPGISKIESVLPANTAFFSGFYISDIDKFFADLRKFQSGRGVLEQRLELQKQIEVKTGVNVQDFFAEIFEGEMARSGIFLDASDKKPSMFFTVKTKSGSFALDKLNELLRSFSNTQSNVADNLIREFKIDNQTTHAIYKFPIKNFTSMLFGDMIGNVETEWFAVYDNYLIFSDSYSALGKVILSNMLGETLMSDNEYGKFQSGLASKNNYYFYCNTSVCFSRASLFFNEFISNDIANNEEFRKFRHLSWQIGSSGNMLYNNSSIVFDQNLKLKSQPVWQSHLSAPLAMKPFIVENKYDLQSKEIVLFDTQNNLYLLNNVGRIVWQQSIGSPILGEISLIDLNKNGDYQLVFNTKEKLFVLDKKGNHADNFPVNFKINASNGVSVFDYENTHNYRFFIACEDQVIYAYDQDGNPVEGWQPYKTDHLVTKPIQHFIVEGKDYIVAIDRMKDYIFDRKGNIRVKTDFVYQHSTKNNIYLEKRTSKHEPRMVTTDSEGNIHHVNFDGEHKTTALKPLDDTHFFIAANIDGDEELEYIFTQTNQVDVFNTVGETLFNLRLNEPSLEKPTTYSFSPKEKKIGVTSSSSNKVYLINNDGSLCKGFPLDGCTGFSIGFISDDKSRFNLFVGSPDSYLYNYLVE